MTQPQVIIPQVQPRKGHGRPGVRRKITGPKPQPIPQLWHTLHLNLQHPQNQNLHFEYHLHHSWEEDLLQETYI